MCMIEKVSAERYVDDTLLNSIHLTKKQLSVSVFVYSLSMQTIFPGDINFQLVFVLAFTMPLIVALKRIHYTQKSTLVVRKTFFYFHVFCYIVFVFVFFFIFYLFILIFCSFFSIKIIFSA